MISLLRPLHRLKKFHSLETETNFRIGERKAMTKLELIAYLKDIASLEQDVYTLDETADALEKQRKKPRQRTFNKPVYREVNTQDVVNATNNSNLGICVLSVVLGIIISIPIFRWWTLLMGPIMCFALVIIFQQISMSSAKKSLTEKRQSEYEAGMTQFEQDTTAEAERYAQEKEEADRIDTSVDKHLAEIRIQKADVVTALQKLYALNIIYPKYRVIIPVTMFCEYLEAGRCETLDGADGAYNKYEEELRMERVIGNLGQIKSNLSRISNQLGNISGQLGKIQQNQYSLYHELQEGNRIAESISNSAFSIAQSNAAIAANTAWTAYSAAATARSTRAIAHCVEFEHTQKYVLTP